MLKLTVLQTHHITSKIVVSLRSRLASRDTASLFNKVSIGQILDGTIREVHAEQIVLQLDPTGVTALLSLSNLAFTRNVTPETLVTELYPGQTLNDLVVSSKNEDKMLVIVSSRRRSQFSIGSKDLSFESAQLGLVVNGRVIGMARKGAIVRISRSLTAILHITDVSDDFASGVAMPQINTSLTGCIVALDQQTKQAVLSIRPSRIKPGPQNTVVDPDLTLADIRPLQRVRGFVKSITNHGVFITIGRNLDARVQIKELFDEVCLAVPSSSVRVCLI